MAVICVALSTLKLEAAMPPNFTAVAPVKLVPMMATEVPSPPDVGVKLSIVGAGAGTKTQTAPWFELSV